MKFIRINLIRFHNDMVLFQIHIEIHPEQLFDSHPIMFHFDLNISYQHHLLFQFNHKLFIFLSKTVLNIILLLTLIIYFVIALHLKYLEHRFKNILCTFPINEPIDHQLLQTFGSDSHQLRSSACLSEPIHQSHKVIDISDLTGLSDSSV